MSKTSPFSHQQKQDNCFILTTHLFRQNKNTGPQKNKDYLNFLYRKWPKYAKNKISNPKNGKNQSTPSLLKDCTTRPKKTTPDKTI